MVAAPRCKPGSALWTIGVVVASSGAALCDEVVADVAGGSLRCANAGARIVLITINSDLHAHFGAVDARAPETIGAVGAARTLRRAIVLVGEAGRVALVVAPTGPPDIALCAISLLPNRLAARAHHALGRAGASARAALRAAYVHRAAERRVFAFGVRFAEVEQPQGADDDAAIVFPAISYAAVFLPAPGSPTAASAIIRDAAAVVTAVEVGVSIRICVVEATVARVGIVAAPAPTVATGSARAAVTPIRLDASAARAALVQRHTLRVQVAGPAFRAIALGVDTIALAFAIVAIADIAIAIALAGSGARASALYGDGEQGNEEDCEGGEGKEGSERRSRKHHNGGELTTLAGPHRVVKHRGAKGRWFRYRRGVSFGEKAIALLSAGEQVPGMYSLFGLPEGASVMILLAFGTAGVLFVCYLLELTVGGLFRSLFGENSVAKPVTPAPLTMQTEELRLGLDLVRARRKALAPREERLKARRDEFAKALEDFRGTRAERDFRERSAHIERACEEAGRASVRLCDLEAQLWMQNAAFCLAVRVKRALSERGAVSAEQLATLRDEIEAEVREAVDADVRQRTWRGSTARKILDDAHESLREHLAALRLRELDASVAAETRSTLLDALVLEVGRSSDLEDEMREIDAHTEAVLEVERLLA